VHFTDNKKGNRKLHINLYAEPGFRDAKFYLKKVGIWDYPSIQISLMRKKSYVLEELPDLSTIYGYKLSAYS